MVNKKEILIFTILSTCTFLFYNNMIIGSIFSIIEIVFVIMTLIIRGSINKAFYWHLMFILSSLESPIDETISSNIIYSYKHFEIPFLPISVSTIILLFLFILSFFKKKNVVDVKKDYIHKFILILFALPIFSGMVGIFGRGYEIINFIDAAMIPAISLCTYSILIQNKDSKEIQRLKSLLISALVGSVLSSYAAGILGVHAAYGGNVTWPGNQILIFSPFLIDISIYHSGKKKIFLFLIGALACIELLVINASGKSIIFVFVALGIYLYKMGSNRNRIMVFIFASTFLFISTMSILNYASEKSNLFRSKQNEVSLLFNINGWGTQFEAIPFSPRVRIIEAVDIFLSSKENIIDLIIGKGFGGYFEDKSTLFYNLDLSQGAFSPNEIMSGKFLRPHESVNEILLLNGFLGIFIWLAVLLKLFKTIFKDNTNSIYRLIGFIFVGIMWNTYVILTYFGLICLYVSQYEFVCADIDSEIKQKLE